MYGLVDHTSAARCFPFTSPRLHIVIFFGTGPGHHAPDSRYLSIRFIFDQLFQLFGCLIQTVLETDTDLKFRMVLFKLHILRSLCLIQSHRFFTEYIDSHLRSLFRDRIMEIMRKTNMYTVRFFFLNHFFIIRIKRNSLRRALFGSGIDITHCTELNFIVRRDRSNMNRGDVTKTYHCCFFHNPPRVCTLSNQIL